MVSDQPQGFAERGKGPRSARICFDPNASNFNEPTRSLNVGLYRALECLGFDFNDSR